MRRGHGGAGKELRVCIAPVVCRQDADAGCEQVQLRPTLKTNGFSIPGFHSGWFLLRNRRRSFVAITDGRRKLWLPGSGRHDLLIEPADPAALLARLRELAMHSGRG